MLFGRRLKNSGRRNWMYFTIGISVFFAVVLLVNWSWIWSGLAALNLETTLFLGKSVWDWLDLLFVPVVLGLLGWVTQRLVKSQEELRRAQEKTLADDHNRQEVLKDYLDQMTNLLTHVEDLSAEGNEARKGIIRARTLAVVRELDERRNQTIVNFIRDSNLHSYYVPSNPDLVAKVPYGIFKDADLSNAKLSGTYLMDTIFNGAILNGATFRNSYCYNAGFHNAELKDADLSNAKLVNAGFRRAILTNANFKEADLSGADLSEANLNGANLSEADLSGADLSSADLSGANLSEADLSGTDLYGANLNGAISLTEKQLSNASLCKTILPKGIKLDPNRDCKRTA